MEFDIENRRHLALLVLAVAGTMIVASIGFQTLSENPLVPDADLNASDAADEYNLTGSGTTGMLVVEHDGGESVSLANVDLILGSRSEGLHFNQSHDWRVEVGEFVYETRLNGEQIDGGADLTRGDRLTVENSGGNTDTNATFDVRVRLYHFPSQTMILDQRVDIE